MRKQITHISMTMHVPSSGAEGRDQKLKASGNSKGSPETLLQRVMGSMREVRSALGSTVVEHGSKVDGELQGPATRISVMGQGSKFTEQGDFMNGSLMTGSRTYPNGDTEIVDHTDLLVDLRTPAEVAEDAARDQRMLEEERGSAGSDNN